MTDSENVSVYAMLDAFVGDETADVNEDTVGAVMSEMFVLIVCALEVTPPAVAVYVKESAPDKTPPGVKVNAPVADVMAAVPLVPWVPRAKVTLPDGSYPGRKPENEPTSDIASVVGDARVGTVAEVAQCCGRFGVGGAVKRSGGALGTVSLFSLSDLPGGSGGGFRGTGSGGAELFEGSTRSNDRVRSGRCGDEGIRNDRNSILIKHFRIS